MATVDSRGRRIKVLHCVMSLLPMGIDVLLALLSGLLLILSFPNFDIEFFAWIALVPLLIAVKGKSPKSAFGLSFLTGIIFLMGVFYWINIIDGVTWTDFLLMGVYLGSYFGVFGLALRLISQRTQISPVFAAPCIWVSMEYLRSHAGFLGLPWALLGHSQYLNIPVIQISSITGVYGISFLIVMVNTLLSEIMLVLRPRKEGTLPGLRTAPLKPVLATAAILGVSLLYGFSVLSDSPEEDKVSVSVIQGNIPQALKWNPKYRKRHLEKHARLTREAAGASRPSLIVWPEGSVQRPLTHALALRKMLFTLAKETNSHLLVGNSSRPKIGPREFNRSHWFNSAFLVSPDKGIVGQYNKIGLLPFAEYLPYKDLFPWPSRFASRAGSFVPGKEYTVFNLNGAKFAVLICWESIFPDLFRKFVTNGADFTVNIANEAWFEETSAPYQFLAMNVFRAVENRVSLVRSANTGVSGFIDPYGRVTGTVKDKDKEIFVDGHLTMEVPLARQRTFYTIYGDIFAYMNLTMAVLLLFTPLLKSSREYRRRIPACRYG